MEIKTTPVQGTKSNIDVYEFKTDAANSSRVLSFELQGTDQKKRFLAILKVFRHTLAGMLKESAVPETNGKIKANLRLENGDVSLKLNWEGDADCKIYHDLVLYAIGELALEISEPSKENKNQDAESTTQVE